MKIVLMLLGIVAVLAGLLFAGQGAGIIDWPRSSFMVHQGQWIVYGLILAAAGLALIWLGARRRG